MTEINDPKDQIRVRPIEFAIFCDYASISLGGKMNMNGIFDRIYAEKLPAMHATLFVVTKMLVPKGEHKITLTLMQEDKVLAKTNVEKEGQDQLSVNTHFWNVQNLKIEDWAPIELQVLMDGKQIYVKRLPVVKVERKEEGKN